MAGNVMSWNEAIKKGYEPRLYPFSFEQVPIGIYTAQLDFKIWAKKVMAINCYFNQVAIGKKFQLTVYCGEQGIYGIPNSDINFVTCPTEFLYKIEIFANEKKKVVFKSAIGL